jgi:hypothetical protein
MAPQQFRLTSFLKHKMRTLDQVCLPEWHKIQAHEWDCYATHIANFVWLARDSLELLKSFDPKVPQDLLELEGQIIWQYF